MRKSVADHESSGWPTSPSAWLRLGAQGVLGLLFVWAWLVVIFLGFA